MHEIQKPGCYRINYNTIIIILFLFKLPRAPISMSLGTRWPLRWSATRLSNPPTRVPPMNTAGAFSPAAVTSSSSSSITVGWTPIFDKSCFITWHMQQLEERVKITTGFSEISRWILISGDSETSMASEQVGGVSSRRTPPSCNRSPFMSGRREILFCVGEK